MLILLCVIGFIILCTGIFIYAKYRHKLYPDNKEWIYWIINGVGVVVFGISLIALIAVGINYSSRMTIDDKIEIYTTENAKIEQQMSVIVEKYMDYESTTLEKFKVDGEETVMLVSLYPELQSNELVAKQIEIYVRNNAAIKELECEKLKYRLYAWWLFFGK